MSLIDEIIDALGSQDHSLVDALLKTKILLHEIGHKELVGWVNNELNGYPEEAELPEYRLLSAHVLGNVAGIGIQYTAHPLPIGHLSDDQRKTFTTARMPQSLAVLERFAASKGGHLEAPIPLEANGLLGKTLAQGLVIQRAWCQLSDADLAQIFVQVRSRLLDFVLELRGQLDATDTPQDIKQAALEVDAAGLFRNAIFGDNATIVLGSHNATQVTITNRKGDFEGLAAALRAQGMDELDISALKTAVATDEATAKGAEGAGKTVGTQGAPDTASTAAAKAVDGQDDAGVANETGAALEKAESPKPGPGAAVKEWMGRVVAKTMDGTWAISTAVAANTISEALKNYFGWH